MINHSLYIHLPFCASKCPYCDFNSISPPSPPFQSYIKAILSQWHQLRPLIDGSPISVYIGGGTPSIWPAAYLTELLETIDWKDDAETTIEINPASCDTSWLKSLKNSGINRVSIGVQALCDTRLRQLGRGHTHRDAIDAVAAALEVDFSSVSADIIYGTPAQTPLQLQDELTQLAALGIHHVSAYELTISPHTPFGAIVRSGTSCTVDEDEKVTLWHTVRDTLEGNGFALYEVSNYAKPSHTSRHNRHYWTGGGYLGLGAGAHGFIHTKERLFRYANTSDVETYISTQKGANLPFQFENQVGLEQIETLTVLEHAREQVMLGCRTIFGFPIEHLLSTLPKHRHAWKKTVDRLLHKGLGQLKEGYFIPTEKGLLQADAIAEEFF